MPKPPPRLSSPSATPLAWRTWAVSPTTRCAAASKPAVSKICEPMWLCAATAVVLRNGLGVLGVHAPERM